MLLNGLGTDFSDPRLAKPKTGWSPAPNITLPSSTTPSKGTLIKSSIFDKYKYLKNPVQKYNITTPIISPAVVNAAVDAVNNPTNIPIGTGTWGPPVPGSGAVPTSTVIPPPYAGGGGGGSATSTDTSNDTAQPTPQIGLVGMWNNLSTAGKFAIVGGGVIIIYYGFKMFKGGRTATAPKSI